MGRTPDRWKTSSPRPNGLMARPGTQQRVRCEPDPRERIPSVACRATRDLLKSFGWGIGALREIAIRRTGEAITDWLRRQCLRGLITLEDPNTASGMLRGMMTMEPQRCDVWGKARLPMPRRSPRGPKLAPAFSLMAAWSTVPKAASLMRTSLAFR
jgi:hypothetical protein